MKSDSYKISTALISVSDKTGIVEFAKQLNELGIEIYSTGGTAKTLKDEKIPVKSITELTEFPEILDGRVKTLHPTIHAGLLAKLDNGEHIAQLNKHDIKSIDLLVVNLYPFEETLAKGANHEDLIENIDIGGPAMLRAAAKNYKWTAPVVNPLRYNEIINILLDKDCRLPESYRAELAQEVFEFTSYYDSLIAIYLRDFNKKELPDKLSLPMITSQKLRYGENPHQSGWLYGHYSKIFTQLHGKELSYNNIIDIDAASKLILEFETPALAIIKHTNPCGVGLGKNLSEAYRKAFATDTISPFGGIIVMNRTLDLETAETLHSLFSEVIIAPEFTNDALELLKKKKDRRLITTDFDLMRTSLKYELKSVTGGYLIQTADLKLFDESNLKVVTKRQPTKEEYEAMMFGWKVAKHVKSNAIVYSLSDRTLGIGAGQMSRVDSSRIAVEKAKMMNLNLKGSAIASDAFFPFPDGVLEAAKAGATAVIQPGGSVRDEEVIQAADENNMTMIFTGMRHFKH